MDQEEQSQEETRLTVSAYGHAFQVPRDFTDQQINQIASRFSVFTVEKRHAWRVYGDRRAPRGSPLRYNSIEASVETARRIKSVNPDVKVLMYWNSAIHYNMYECETAVERSSWLMPANFHPGHGSGLYDYRNADFRQWWVNCAVDAVLGSGGMLDGVFVDAAPKVTWQGRGMLTEWNLMVGELSSRIGEQRLVMYNGFHMPGNNRVSRIIAGPDQLAHAHLYCESFGRAVDTGRPHITLEYLTFLQEAFNQNPSKMLFGHGPNSQSKFSYIYGCFLMVAPRAGAHFLANSGYRITQGLLTAH